MARAEQEKINILRENWNLEKEKPVDKLNDFKSEHHRLNEKLKEYDKEEVSEEHSLLDDEKGG